jgi:hypothetical protein
LHSLDELAPTIDKFWDLNEQQETKSWKQN